MTHSGYVADAPRSPAITTSPTPNPVAAPQLSHSAKMRRDRSRRTSRSCRSFCVRSVGCSPDSKGPTLSELMGDRCARLAYRISRISTFPEGCPSSRGPGKRDEPSHSNRRRKRAILHRAYLPVQRSALSYNPLHLEGPAAASRSECVRVRSGCLR